MAESFKEKRVQFLKGQQHIFLERCQQALDFTNIELAYFLGIHQRTLLDWKREKFLCTLTALKKLQKVTEIQLPKNIVIKEQYWYAKKGAKKGGIAAYKKYEGIGDPEIRKERWKKWWDEIGKYSANPLFIAKDWHYAWGWRYYPLSNYRYAS